MRHQPKTDTLCIKDLYVWLHVMRIRTVNTDNKGLGAEGGGLEPPFVLLGFPLLCKTRVKTALFTFAFCALGALSAFGIAKH